jgi:hypothetical protein
MFKSIFTLLVLLAKLYLGFRILIWGIMEISNPELHNLSEIEGYLVFAVFDIWISHSTTSIKSMNQED